MSSKRIGSEDTDGNVARAVAEQVSSSLPIYKDTKLYLDKDVKLKWQEVNEKFVGTFGEHLEDHQVYMNIYKSGFYQIACRYPVFACVDMIHSIASHTDPKIMTLSSVSGMKLATFWE